MWCEAQLESIRLVIVFYLVLCFVKIITEVLLVIFYSNSSAFEGVQKHAKIHKIISVYLYILRIYKIYTKNLMNFNLLKLSFWFFFFSKYFWGVLLCF